MAHGCERSAVAPVPGTSGADSLLSDHTALDQRMETSEVGQGIGAASGNPLPTGRIVGEVSSRATYPRTMSRPAQLTRSGINERVPGTARLPCLEIVGTGARRISIEARPPFAVGQRRKMIEEVISK